jgi:hypothetical protein
MSAHFPTRPASGAGDAPEIDVIDEQPGQVDFGHAAEPAGRVLALLVMHPATWSRRVL